MEKTYRLEFNEKQQHFHLDSYTHKENTNGWFTVFEHCTDLDFKIFESFINRVPKNKLTKEYVLKSSKEIKGFVDNLFEYGLMVSKTHPPT